MAPIRRADPRSRARRSADSVHAPAQPSRPGGALPAARAWSTYEGACSTLLPSADTVAYFSSDHVALGLARIEAHYFSHRIFLPENALLDNVHRLRGIPAVIVQGRYDMVCPPVTADDLHRAWPEAEYIVVPDAGHSAWEPGIRAQLVAAMERFKAVLPRAARRRS